MDGKIRIIIVDDSRETVENIRTLLRFETTVEVIGAAFDGKESIKLCEKLKPDIVLMDVNMPEMDGLTATQIITMQFPEIGVIIMSVQGEKEYLKKAMVAGAREYIVKPFSSEDLVQTILKTYEMQNRRKSLSKVQDHQISTRIFTVFSTKGGVGKTTIASNLAVAMARTTKKRVALIDMDLQFGDIAVMLNLSIKNTIYDLVKDLKDMDSDIIEDYMVTHFSGVSVLPAPAKPEYSEFIDAKHIEKILNLLIGNYHYIIIDAAASFNETVLTALDMSEKILCVSTLDLPTIKNIKVGLDLMDSLKYSHEKIHIVLNKASEQFGVKYKEFEQTIGHPVWAYIPEDSQTVITSANKGLPFVMTRSETKVARAIYSISEALCERKADEQKEKQKRKWI
ncbi:MAG: response regulator [Thermoclostridium sp.]|nr:response regulator [Thermoclostridium sp.]